jgi:hypothetical protein
MLPELAAVFRAEVPPTAYVSDETRIEPVGLRLCEQLALSACVIGTQDMHDVSHLQGVEIGHDRGTTEPNGLRKARDLEESPALTQQGLGELQERAALLDPEELLHVSCEVRVQPLALELGVDSSCEQRLRQTAEEEAIFDAIDTEGTRLFGEDRNQVNRALAVSQATGAASQACSRRAAQSGRSIMKS